MSVYVTAYIWEHSAQTGNALLLLLAIGDIADKDGKAYPSVRTLARFTRMSERTIQRMLPRLVTAGELRLDPRGSHLGTHLFEVVMNRTLPLFDPKEGGVTNCHPVTNGRGGVTKDPKGGDTAVSPEPEPVIRTTNLLPGFQAQLQTPGLTGPARRQAIAAACQAAGAAIDYLNAKAGTRYRHTEASLKFPMARILTDGASLEDLKAVVDLKAADPDFGRKYLRPETLWNATKFAGYIGQVGMQAQAPARPAIKIVSVLAGTRDQDNWTGVYSLRGTEPINTLDVARTAVERAQNQMRRALGGRDPAFVAIDIEGRPRAVYSIAELRGA